MNNSILATGPAFVATLATKSPETIYLKLKYDQPFFLLTIPLVILSAAAALFLGFLVWFFYRWWQSRYVFAPSAKPAISKPTCFAKAAGPD